METTFGRPHYLFPPTEQVLDDIAAFCHNCIEDGDTFEARVRIWPGMDVTTKVRLRTVDAPETQYRCDEERVKAQAARDALAAMLRQGSVTITNVQQDRYGGRVDADVATAGTPNVADALLARGLARPYDGGRRDSWCG